MSCSEHAEHHPQPPPGAPRHALWGKEGVQHTAACGEAQTSAFGSGVCVQRQVRRGETEKMPPSSTRKQLVAAPVLNFLFFFFLFICLLCFLMTGVAGMSAELGLHHNQSSGTLEGFPQGNCQTWWGRAPPQCRCWGTHFPSLPLSGSLAPHAVRCTWGFCQAGGEGDQPSPPPEIVPMLTSPQPTARTPSAGSP